MVSRSPNWGCSPSEWPNWVVNRGYLLLTNWDDAPSGWFFLASLDRMFGSVSGPIFFWEGIRETSNLKHPLPGLYPWCTCDGEKLLQLGRLVSGMPTT